MYKKKLFAIFFAVIMACNIFINPITVQAQIKSEKAIGLVSVGLAVASKVSIRNAIRLFLTYSAINAAEYFVQDIILDEFLGEKDLVNNYYINNFGVTTDNKVVMSEQAIRDITKYVVSVSEDGSRIIDTKVLNAPDYHGAFFPGSAFTGFSFRSSWSSNWYHKGSKDLQFDTVGTPDVKINIKPSGTMHEYMASHFELKGFKVFANAKVPDRPIASGCDMAITNGGTIGFLPDGKPDIDVPLEDLLEDGVFNPDGTVVPEEDNSDPSVVVEFSDILNIVADTTLDYFLENVTRDGKIGKVAYIKNGITFEAETWVDKDLIVGSDLVIGQELQKDIAVKINKVAVDKPIIGGFEWIKKPSTIKGLDENSEGGYIKWKCTLKVPYPTTAHKNISVEVSHRAYQGETDGYTYETFSDTVPNISFKEIDEEPLPPPHEDHVDADEDGKCDECGENINKPLPPTPPPDGDILAWLEYLGEMLAYMMKITIYAVTAPIRWLASAFSSLGGYISTMLTELTGIGDKIGTILSWIPKPIIDFIWGAMSLIIIFCSIKMFKNMSNK